MEPTDVVDALDRGRDAFRRRSWGDAYGNLSSADRADPLQLEDLENLAVASYLAGKDAESEEFWGRAHHESLAVSDWGRAARCAFWLGITLMNRSERAKGGGWLARAQRVLDDSQHDCAERGWMLVPLGLRVYAEGDFSSSLETFRRAGAIGAAFRDSDLVTTARQAEGRALIRMGETVAGVALLDEAMVAVTAGEVSPIPSGIIYCSVVEACQEILDVRRAREWTAALSAWCAAQPDLVPYRGRCMIHRSEIMQLHGEWRDALEEVRRACERLAVPPQPQLGAAFYQRAELHRLRGEFAKAEDAYREASQKGRIPEPGLALLRLAQGRVEAAVIAIRRAADEANVDVRCSTPEDVPSPPATDPVSRSKILPAWVEIMLAAGDVVEARAAADDLSEIAREANLPLLRGIAAAAQGAVLLVEGDARAALNVLRTACREFDDLDVPYETARARALVATAYRALGDEDGATLEVQIARRILERLGAVPDLARLDALSGKPGRAADGLTAREMQLLALVAKGKSNKEIAAELVISDRTVARHMSNIFTKLGVSTRTAASAYAFERGLV